MIIYFLGKKKKKKKNPYFYAGYGHYKIDLDI